MNYHNGGGGQTLLHTGQLLRMVKVEELLGLRRLSRRQTLPVESTAHKLSSLVHF